MVVVAAVVAILEAEAEVATEAAEEAVEEAEVEAEVEAMHALSANRRDIGPLIVPTCSVILRETVL